jgi:hypothetical protein
MNEILAGKGNHYQKGKSKYTDMKAEYGQLVANYAREQQIKPVEAAYFTYFFMEPNKRRDPSNFTSGGAKIIEDGLQSAGILKNDDKECPGVMLYMTEFKLSEEEVDAVLLLMVEGDDDQQ